MVSIKTPALVYNTERLRRNVEFLDKLSKDTGVTILYALKASYAVLPFLKNKEVTGEVSSLFEARYAVETLGRKAHAFFVSLTEEDWDAGVSDLCSHISFNSFRQGQQFARRAVEKGIKCGVRVNPEVSNATYSDYDPCEMGGRFGVSLNELPAQLPEWVTGLHVHALCENGAEEFVSVLDVFEEQAQEHLKKLSWVNFGGGHLFTDESYDRELFVRRVGSFKEKFPHLSIYFEPGAAWVWDAATLQVAVTDVVMNRGVSTLILDTSFRAHLSDFLVGAAVSSLHIESTTLDHVTAEEYAEFSPQQKRLTYRLGGASCAACDYKEFYKADREIKVRDILTFRNMGHYVDVTFSMFNGIVPPSVYYKHEDETVELVKSYSFEDFCSLLP